MIKKLAPKHPEGENTTTTVLKPPEKKVVPSKDDELAWTQAVDHKNNSYLVLTNQAGRTIKAGEQIMFFYGRYTNAYLLMNYGFCYRDNKYDQFDISLEMRPASMVPEDILCFDWERTDGIQAIYLKSDKLDNTLLCYLRLLVQTETMFQGDDEKEDEDADKVTKNSSTNTSLTAEAEMLQNFTIVADLNTEKRSLSLYRKVLLHVLKKTEAKTTLEEDLKLICSDQNTDW